MPAIKIPDQHKDRLVDIGNLDECTYKALLSALATATPALFAGELADQVLKSTTAIKRPKLRQIISTLVSLYGARTTEHLGVDRFIKDLKQAIDRDTAFSKVDKENLLERLAELLALDESIGVTSKASAVALENDHTFYDVRILTDIRPIFSDSLDKAPENAVLLHTLKINYHDSDSRDHKDFFVTLDSTDLLSLRDTIERAENKERTLVEMMSNAKIRLLGTDQEAS